MAFSAGFAPIRGILAQKRRDQTVKKLVNPFQRREGDSNPRNPFEFTRFPGEPVQPLWHLSVYYFAPITPPKRTFLRLNDILPPPQSASADITQKIPADFGIPAYPRKTGGQK